MIKANQLWIMLASQIILQVFTIGAHNFHTLKVRQKLKTFQEHFVSKLFNKKTHFSEPSPTMNFRNDDTNEIALSRNWGEKSHISFFYCLTQDSADLLLFCSSILHSQL